MAEEDFDTPEKARTRLLELLDADDWEFSERCEARENLSSAGCTTECRQIGRWSSTSSPFSRETQPCGVRRRGPTRLNRNRLADDRSKECLC